MRFTFGLAYNLMLTSCLLVLGLAVVSQAAPDATNATGPASSIAAALKLKTHTFLDSASDLLIGSRASGANGRLVIVLAVLCGLWILASVATRPAARSHHSKTQSPAQLLTQSSAAEDQDADDRQRSGKIAA